MAEHNATIEDREVPYNPFAPYASRMREVVELLTKAAEAQGAVCMVFDDKTFHLETFGDPCRTAHALLDASDAVFEQLAEQGVCAQCRNEAECRYQEPEFGVGDVVVTVNDPDTQMSVVSLLPGTNRIWVEVEWEETPGYVREEVFAQSLLRKVQVN